MTDGDLRDQISYLETRIEDLADVIERCRKIILASKIAIATGGFYVVAGPLGVIPFDLTAMIAAMTAVIGGIVVFGSNTATSQQASANMAAAEKLRVELIGQLELRVVDAGLMPHASYDGSSDRLPDGKPPTLH